MQCNANALSIIWSSFHQVNSSFAVLQVVVSQPYYSTHVVVSSHSSGYLWPRCGNPFLRCPDLISHPGSKINNSRGDCHLSCQLQLFDTRPNYCPSITDRHILQVGNQLW